MIIESTNYMIIKQYILHDTKMLCKHNLLIRHIIEIVETYYKW